MSGQWTRGVEQLGQLAWRCSSEFGQRAPPHHEDHPPTLSMATVHIARLTPGDPSVNVNPNSWPQVASTSSATWRSSLAPASPCAAPHRRSGRVAPPGSATVWTCRRRRHPTSTIPARGRPHRRSISQAGPRYARPPRISGRCLPRTPPLPPEWDRWATRSCPQFVGFAGPFTGRRNAIRPDPERGAPAARSTQAALVTLRAPLWGYRCSALARRLQRGGCTTMSSDHRNRSRRRRSFSAGMLAMSEPGGAERRDARSERHRATASDHGPRG